MIHEDDFILQEGIYVRDGGGLFRVIGYCEMPSVTMVNVVTGKRIYFAIQSPAGREFQRVDGLKYSHENGQIKRDNPSHGGEE